MYVSTDRVFSEPVLQEYERRSGVKVNAVYDTEETKSTGLANRLLAETGAATSGRVLVERAGPHAGAEVPRACWHLIARRSGRDSRRHSVDPEGYWTGFSARMRVIAYNTKLGQARRSAAIGRRSGRPEVEGPGRDGGPAVRIDVVPCRGPLRRAGRCEGGRFLPAAESERRPDRRRQFRGAGSRRRGEVKVGLTDTDDVNVAIEAGQPIAMVLPDKDGLGVPVMPNMVSLIAGAPASGGGTRLIDYLLSADVERMLAESEAVQIPLHRWCAGTEEHAVHRQLQADDARLLEGGGSGRGRHPAAGDDSRPLNPLWPERTRSGAEVFSERSSWRGRRSFSPSPVCCPSRT